VSSGDVDGITITIPPAFSISGILRIEGGAPLPDVSPAGRLGINMRRPVIGGAGSSILDVFAQVGPDGAFRLDGATAGPYRLLVSGFPSQFYVKEARYGPADIWDPRFEFTGRENQQLDIVLSPNVASMEGSVTNSRGEPAAAAQIVLAPDRSRERTELYKTATSDRAGRFVMTNIAPGEYTLFAWEVVEPYSWFDPEVLKRDQPSGRVVRVTESSRTNINLQVITAR
jgi:hypothetical protein